jgi:hypothetical protein
MMPIRPDPDPHNTVPYIRILPLQVGAASGAEGVGGLLWPAQDDLTVSPGQSDRPQSILEVDL